MKKLVFLVVLLVFVGSACAADITTGLVGWWKMDGQTDPGNARIVKDYSGFGNDGTMGSSDQWIAGGGIDFDGGYWGASGITFANNGADLCADMALTSQVTISYVGTWDGPVGSDPRWPNKGANYPYDGRSVDTTNDGGRLLSAECPTGSHFLDHKGGTKIWGWEAFNETDSRFIFQKNDLGKTWGDMVTITATVNFDTGDYKIYVDGQLYTSATGQAGSFANLAYFTIGRATTDTYACMDGSMSDFRIYNRELSAEDVAALVPEPATLALLGLGSLTLIRRKK